MPANLGNSAVATGPEKVSFHSNPKERQCQRMLNYCTIALISHASKVARLQQYLNRELPDVQAGFRKGRGTRDQIANICWIMEKASEFQKNIYFCFLDYAKAFDFVDHNKLWKILQEMGIPNHLTCLAVQGTLKESSSALQLKSISSLVLSFLYGLTLTSIRDYWKNHSFD